MICNHCKNECEFVDTLDRQIFENKMSVEEKYLCPHCGEVFFCQKEYSIQLTDVTYYDKNYNLLRG